jgi:formylglycine-generating enzyme required for sulfatase activity
MSPIRNPPGRIDNGIEPAAHPSTPATALIRPRLCGFALGAAVLALAVLGLATYAYHIPGEISGSRLQQFVRSLPWERAESRPARFKDLSYALSSRAREALAPPASDVSRTAAPQTANGVFQDCEECPQMVVVPAGNFVMGSLSSESVGPQHRVTIDYSFAVGRYPITRDEYKEFVSQSGYAAGAGWKDPGFTQTGKDPVVDESWNDAQAYVKWLSTKTGKNYRLLSEAEYEYAERAGTATAYWWGEGDDTAKACSHANESDCGHRGTVPTGSYPPNAFGLYDMAGNAWEWTQDCYHSSYAGAPQDGTAWTTGGCLLRSLRGGSWRSKTKSLRSANRYVDYRGNRGSDADGSFRMALTL